MGFINQFPYTDFHQLNIDWLLSTTKLLKEQVDYLLEEFAKIEILTPDEIKALIAADIAVNNQVIYQRMAEQKIEITSEYVAYVTNQLELIRNYTDALIADQKIYIDNQDTYYNSLSRSYADHAVVVANAYTDSKLIDYTYMVSPVTGEYEDVRNVLTEVVNYFLTDNALTAGEYDALDLTAEAYDAYDLSAFDYDFNGKILLV